MSSSPHWPRLDRAIARAGARYLTRRAVWRQAEGDPDRYREIASARIEAGYLFHDPDDQDDPPPPPSEWRRLGRRLRVWALAGAVAIATVIALDVLPFPDVWFTRW